MSKSDYAFYRPDINWNLLGTSANPVASALPVPLVLQNGDTRSSETAADGTPVSLRFAIGSALWEPTAGVPGTATVVDLQNNVLLSISYDGRNLPVQLSFNPAITTTNGIRVSAPTGTIRVWVQGYSRFGG